MRQLLIVLSIIFLVSTAWAAGNGQQAKIITKKMDNVSVHTFLSPAKSAMVTSHVIEGPTRLLVVDAQFLLPFARELKTFIETLGKPVERVIVTHSHPDHYFGCEVLADYPLSTFASISNRIAKIGAKQIAPKKPKMGDLIPDVPTVPKGDLKPGVETFDGITLDIESIKDVEGKEHVVITLPQQGILIAQDIVYNKVHFYVGNDTISNWLAAIDYLEAKPGISTVLCGHGEPATPEVYASVREYLTVAAGAIEKAKQGGFDVKPVLTKRFPDYAADFLLDTSNFVLFSKLWNKNK